LTFRFGAFELSTDSGELRKHGVSIKLAPQPFQVLVALVERAGELVTREELHDRLWRQSETSVEFDAGLNRCIRQIRAALSDDADAPRYIETAPRRGYRFVAALGEYRGSARDADGIAASQAVVPPTAPSLPPVPERHGAKRRPWLWIGAAAVLVAGALLAVVILRSYRPHVAEDFKVVPLAVSAGDQIGPAFSPEGKHIVYSWNGDDRDNFDIYVKYANSQSPSLRLTSDPATDYSPAWSPDGQWIAFCREGDPDGGAIWIVPALGGAERKIIDLGATGNPINRSLAWLRDSQTLVTSTRPSGELRKGLRSINIETGEIRLLTVPSADEEDMDPAVSPDGRTLAFTRDVGRGVSSIMLLPISRTANKAVAPTPLLRGQAPDTFNARPAWMPDNRHIIFASNAGGSQNLWLAAVDSATAPVKISVLGDGLETPDVSATGDLLIVRQTSDLNIWQLDLRQLRDDRKIHTAIFSASTRVEESPAVSPDGRQVAFESGRSGFSEIWIRRVDGSKFFELTSIHTPVTGSPDWSPDGTRLIFDSRTSGVPRIYSMAPDGGQVQKLSSATMSQVVPKWSADGKSIYYSSSQTGRMEVWRMSASGAVQEQVTRDGGFAGAPSADGELLYYLATNDPVSALWELRLGSGQRTMLHARVANRGFAVTPNGVYFVSYARSGFPDSLHFYDRHARKETFSIPWDRQIGPGMAVSPNGNSLYYTQIDREGHEILFASHFWK
jgi:Tol biopolymer transport system component/DNA-binding winged helix-turn-helix (wHTH) protein